jgi:hypothetical protein
MDYFHKVPVILQDEIQCEPPWQPRSVQIARDKSTAVVVIVRTARATNALQMHYTVTELNTSHVVIAAKYNKTGNISINVTWRRVRVTIVAEQMQ